MTETQKFASKFQPIVPLGFKPILPFLLIALFLVVGNSLLFWQQLSRKAQEAKSPETYVQDSLSVNRLFKEFDWQPVNGATQYQVALRNVNQEVYEFYEDVGSATHYLYPIPLIPGEYHWITRYLKDNQWSDWSTVQGFNVTFEATNLPQPEYNFNGSISEAVLLNYLSHAIRSHVPSQYGTLANYIQTVGAQEYLNQAAAGAKFILGADSTWRYDPLPPSYFTNLKPYIDQIHQLDPQLILDAFLSEYTAKKIVEQVPIPAYVFQDFGLTPETRNFRYESMFDADWPWINVWQNPDPDLTGSPPDITKLESQLYYYYLATQYIDIGFEDLWFGQIYLTGKNDVDYVHTHLLVEKIRNYAVTHARRKTVLVTSHQMGDVEYQGKDIFDYNYMTVSLTIDASGRMVARLPDKKYFDCQKETGICNFITKHPLEYDRPLLLIVDNGGPGHSLQANGINQDEISYFDSQKSGERRRFIKTAYFGIPLEFSKARFVMPGPCLAPYTENQNHCPDNNGNFAYGNEWNYEMKRCGDDETVRKAYGMWDYLNMEQVILNTPTGAITDTQPVFDWEPVYGAEKYEVYSHNNSINQSVFHKTLEAVTSYRHAAALAAGDYGWIVRYFKNGQWSEWSTPGLFFQVSSASPGTTPSPASASPSPSPSPASSPETSFSSASGISVSPSPSPASMPSPSPSPQSLVFGPSPSPVPRPPAGANLSPFSGFAALIGQPAGTPSVAVRAPASSEQPSPSSVAGSRRPTPSVVLSCSGDYTQDGQVTFQDMLYIMKNWGRPAPDGGVFELRKLLDVLKRLNRC